MGRNEEFLFLLGKKCGVQSKLSVMRFIEKIGRERILFGSDIPFGTKKWELEKVVSLSIGDDKKEWVFFKNLKRLKGLK